MYSQSIISLIFFIFFALFVGESICQTASTGSSTPTVRNVPRTAFPVPFAKHEEHSNHTHAHKGHRGHEEGDNSIRKPFAIDLRAKQAKTVTLPGPVSKYVATGKTAPKPAPTGLQLFFDGDNGGAYAYLGPRLRKQIRKTLKKYCDHKKLNSECREELASVMQQPRVAIVERQVEEVLLWGIGALIAVFYADKGDDSKPAPAYHFPASAVSSLSAIATISDAVIKVGSNTVPISTPSSTLAGAKPTLSVATAPTKDHKKGDIFVDLPKPLLIKAEALMSAGQNYCVHQKRNLKGTTQCVGEAGSILVKSPDMHDLFAAINPDRLVAIVPHVQHLRDEFFHVITTGIGQARLFGETPTFMAAVSTLCAGLAYEFLVQQNSLLENIWFPREAFYHSKKALMDLINEKGEGGGGSATGTRTSTSTKSHCSSDIICQATKCSGDKDKRTCEAGSDKGCRCTNRQPITLVDQFDTSLASLQASVFPSLFRRMGEDPGLPVCKYEKIPLGLGGNHATGVCKCTQVEGKKKAKSTTHGTYSTLKATTGNAACQYTDLPKRTVKVSTDGPAPPTSCKVIPNTITKRELAPPPSHVVETGIRNVNLVKKGKDANKICSCNNGMHSLHTTVMNHGACTSTYCPDNPPPNTAIGGPSECEQPSSDPCNPCFSETMRACKIVITERWGDCSSCSPWVKAYRGIKVYNWHGKLLESNTGLYWTSGYKTLYAQMDALSYKDPKNMDYYMQFKVRDGKLGYDTTVWDTNDTNRYKLPYAVKGKVTGPSGGEQKRITEAYFKCLCVNQLGC